MPELRLCMVTQEMVYIFVIQGCSKLACAAHNKLFFSFGGAADKGDNVLGYTKKYVFTEFIIIVEK